MTKKVLIAKNNGKDLSVRCKVYCGMTNMDAAMMFIKQRGTISNVNMSDKIRVLANYGDKDAIDFIRVTEANGLYISWTGAKSKGAVVAVSTLFSIFKDMNDLDSYAMLVRVIAKAWNGNPDSTKAQILKGMSLFIQTYKNQIKEEILVSRLSDMDPNELIRNASVDRTSGARKYAWQIWNAYNKRLREDNRLPNLL